MSQSKKKKKQEEKEGSKRRHMKEKPRKRKATHPRVPSPPPSSHDSQEAGEEEEAEDSSDLDADVFTKGFDRKGRGEAPGPKGMSDKMKVLCRDMSAELIAAFPTDMSELLGCICCC